MSCQQETVGGYFLARLVDLCATSEKTQNIVPDSAPRHKRRTNLLCFPTLFLLSLKIQRFSLTRKPKYIALPFQQYSYRLHSFMCEHYSPKIADGFR